MAYTTFSELLNKGFVPKQCFQVTATDLPDWQYSQSPLLTMLRGASVEELDSPAAHSPVIEPLFSEIPCYCDICRGSVGAHTFLYYYLALFVAQAYKRYTAEPLTSETVSRVIDSFVRAAYLLLPPRLARRLIALSRAPRPAHGVSSDPETTHGVGKRHRCTIPLLHNPDQFFSVIVADGEDVLSMVGADLVRALDKTIRIHLRPMPAELAQLPALNILAELWHFFCTGRWLPTLYSAHSTFGLVFAGSTGYLARSVAASVPNAPLQGIYPHPAFLGTLCLGDSFVRQFSLAWQALPQLDIQPSAAGRYHLAPFFTQTPPWYTAPLRGGSVGFSALTALCGAFDPNRRPYETAVMTGMLAEDAGKIVLRGVEGHSIKLTAIADLKLPIPLSIFIVCKGDAAKCPNDWRSAIKVEEVNDPEQLIYAATGLTRALRSYLEKTTSDLNSILWANLTLEQVFVEPRLQRRKSAPQRRQSEQQSGAEYLAREAFPTRDNWEEELACLYELLPLGSEYITETVRWKPFTTAVLSANARQALVGAPGSGKTTATKAFARQLAQEALQQMAQGADLRTLRLPLWVRLSEVKLDADAPLDALLTAADVPDGLRAFYREMLQSGRVVVFLDGLDELDETREIRFKRWLQALLEAIGSTPVLLTCRTLPWEQGGRKEWAEALRVQEPHELAPLNLQEQRAFVQKFYADDINKQSDLLRKLDSSFAMRHAARTYLMLTLIALLHKDEDSQEQLRDRNLTLAGIYRQVLRRILKGVWREGSTPALSDEEAERVLLILEKVCFCLLSGAVANKFSYRNWEKLVSRHTNPLELLTLLKAVGLLIETGVEAGELWYSVVHFSFMEYLAGAYLASRKDEQEFWKGVVLGRNPRAKSAKSRRGRSNFVPECGEADFELPSDGWLWYKPEYAETLLFFASAMQDATPLIDAIEAYEKETGGDDIFRQLLIHKARIVAFASVETERRRRIIDEVYHCWLTAVSAFGIEYRFPSSESEQSTSVETRYHPLAMQVESANSENLMRSPVPPLRYLAPAVRVVGHEFVERFIKSPHFTGDLVSHLAFCEAIVLTEYSSPNILSYLNNCLQMLIHRENPVVQQMEQRWGELGNFETSTLRALAKVADSSTISILLNSSLSQNSFVFNIPYQYLSQVCNDSHVPALINALYAPESDIDLIELSLRTIYYYELRIEKNEKLVELLETYSQSEDIPQQVRLRAMQCLSRLEASRAIPLLINFIDTVSEPALQRMAIETLTELRSREVADYLRRLIGMAGEEPTVYPHHYGTINNDDYTIARIASTLIKMGMNDVLNHIINKRLPNGANYQPEHSETDLYWLDERTVRSYEMQGLLNKVAPYEDLLCEYGNVQAVQKIMDIFPQEILDTGLTLAEARERWKRDFPGGIVWLNTAVRICIQILARTPRGEIPSTIVQRLLRLILVRQFVFLAIADLDEFAKIGEPALDALKYEAEEAERFGNWELCAMLIHAIGETRSLHAFEFLKQRLQHPNGKIRAAACEAIGKLERLHRVDREKAFLELKKRLWDYACATQASASIASIGTKHNIESLLEVARKKNFWYNFFWSFFFSFTNDGDVCYFALRPIVS